MLTTRVTYYFLMYMVHSYIVKFKERGNDRLCKQWPSLKGDLADSISSFYYLVQLIQMGQMASQVITVLCRGRLLNIYFIFMFITLYYIYIYIFTCLVWVHRNLNLIILLSEWVIPWTTDTQREYFFKSQTFGLGRTNQAEIFWGIWSIFAQSISTHFGTVSPCFPDFRYSTFISTKN